MESIAHINNALQASLTTRSQNSPINKVDYQVSISSTKDKLLDSITENSQITVFTNFIVPLLLIYLIYMSDSRAVYTQIIKYMIVIGCLKYLYKYLKKEPHPTTKDKQNGHISLLYSFIIITILTLVDYKIINFGNINVFNVSFSLSLIFAFVSILSYGYGLLYTKSYYSTDLITTLLLSYLFYKSNIFFNDRNLQLGGGLVNANYTYNSPPAPLTKYSNYTQNTEFDFA